MNSYYGFLRVKVEPDGRLRPLWYSVTADFESITTVGYEYTVALCVLPARSLEEARTEFKTMLKWFEPLLKGAEPDGWFASEDPAR
jgi:hypothetical protein